MATKKNIGVTRLEALLATAMYELAELVGSTVHTPIVFVSDVQFAVQVEPAQVVIVAVLPLIVNFADELIPTAPRLMHVFEVAPIT